MDFPILINWMSPLSFLGALGELFYFYFIFGKNDLSKQNGPRWDAAFCDLASGAILFAYMD